MERSRAGLLTLVWVSGVWFSRISGAEVEIKVRPGDDVTLYSDCVWKSGLITVWFRNCSHDRQPPFVMSAMDFTTGDRPRYSGVWNQSNQTHDLLVKNISESDLGLYYCAVKETKITNENGVTLFKDVYDYGNRITRLSLLDPYFNLTQPTSTPPVSDCSVCWKLLVSVCPVCAVFSSLLSSTCVYCICRTRTKEAKAGPERRSKAKSRKDRTSETIDQVGEGDEVCYASLDLPSRGKKHLKKKRVDRSAFSTYSEVKT